MKDQWKTQRTLLIRARDQSDQEAWNDFVGYYKSFIHVVLTQMKIRPGDMDDMTQEILLNLWKSLPGFSHDKDRAHFRTWLSRLIHNTVSMDIRGKVRRQNREETVTNDENSDFIKTTTEDEVQAIIDKEWEDHIISLAIDNITPLFSERAIEVFWMSVDGMSTAEISEKLDIKPNSVTKLRARVKNNLAREIQELKEILELVD